MSAAPKFINTPEGATTDEIDGLLILRPDLCRVPGAPNVVVSSHIKRGKVALICGGGSGHEPAHASYVADGWLTGAVCGGVFASPSHTAVLKAIRYVSKENENSGVLVLIKNYAGDVINFSYAATAVKNEGICVEAFVFGDDVAFGAQHDGQRGVAGTVLLYKILGSLASAGASLEKLVETAKIINSETRSIGVSLSSCAVPGQPPTSTLPANVYEIGLGIHGEPGKEQLPVEPLSSIAHRMITLLLSPPDAPEMVTKFGPGEKWDPSEPYVLAVNNLGATTDLEMCCFVSESVSQLQKMNCEIAAIVSGRFMTALEMHAASLTLIRLKQLSGVHVVEHLKSHTGIVPAFYVTAPVQDAAAVVASRTASSSITDEAGVLKQSKAGNSEMYAKFSAVVKVVAAAMLKHEGPLNRMDSAVGDGDIGTGLARSCRAVLHRTEENEQHAPLPISTAMHDMALAIADSWGGTAGPLFGAYFAAVSGACCEYESRAASDPSEVVRAMSAALKAGVLAVQGVGKAQKGDRTMVDAMLPASEAFEASHPGPLDVALSKAIDGATAGAAAAREMRARKGRARYSNLREIGREDAGCELVVLLLRAVAEAIAGAGIR